MRLKAISLIVAVVIALPDAANARSQYLEAECRGEGPKPMLVLPNFISNIHPFPLDEGINDGLYLPKTNAFAFRDQYGTFGMARFGIHTTSKLARFEKAVSKIRDPWERLFTMNGQTRVFDTYNRLWLNYKGAYSGKVRPLFWKGSTLYSAVTSEDPEEERNANFRIQKWTYGATRAKKVCGFLNFTLNSGYKLGEGHTDPSVVLYRTERSKDGVKLTVSLLNVDECSIETKTYADLMKGDVKNVHYYAGMKSVLIEVDHPTQQLVWDNGPDDKHCHVYTLASSKLVVLGYQHPIIGAYDPHDGLNLIYMHDENNNPPKSAQVTGDYPIADIRPNDLELSPDKTALFGITELIDKTRTLVKIDLPKVD